MPPDTPIGRPATKMIGLPASSPATSTACSSPLAKKSSTVSMLGCRTGVIPHRSVRRRCTSALGVSARIGDLGLYLDTLPAVVPVSVKATMSAASS